MKPPRRVAVYVSAHGVGHAVRVAAVLDRLRELVPIRVCVMAGCDRRFWPASLAPVTEAWYREPCDAGVIQSDDVSVDLGATAGALENWLRALPDTIAREARRLRGGSFDLVLGDVPSPAFDAADAVKIPSVAVANFTWDWIYSELGFEAAAAAAAAAYAKATLLLEAAPFGPMAAFRRRVGVGLVARAPAHSRAATRLGLGLGEEEAVTLVAFQPAFAPAVMLPAARRGRRYLLPTGWAAKTLRSDVVVLPVGARFEDALAAADVVVGKPGYGLIGDVEAAGARFLYVARPGFPENAVLERHLMMRAGTASLSMRQLACGRWEDELAALESAAAPAPAQADGALRAAREIAAVLAVDSGREAQ